MSDKNNEVEVPSYLKVSKIVVWFLYFYILLGIISLALRVILLVFSADPTVGFSKLVAQISGDYLQPFRGIFTGRDVGESGYLDVSALFAILIYMLVLWAVQSLIDYVQNKIDISKAEQEQQLAQLRRQKELEASKSARAKK